MAWDDFPEAQAWQDGGVKFPWSWKGSDAGTADGDGGVLGEKTTDGVGC